MDPNYSIMKLSLEDKLKGLRELLKELRLVSMTFDLNYPQKEKKPIRNKKRKY